MDTILLTKTFCLVESDVLFRFSIHYKQERQTRKISGGCSKQGDMPCYCMDASWFVLGTLSMYLLILFGQKEACDICLEKLNSQTTCRAEKRDVLSSRTENPSLCAIVVSGDVLFVVEYILQELS